MLYRCFTDDKSKTRLKIEFVNQFEVVLQVFYQLISTINRSELQSISYSEQLVLIVFGEECEIC